jgi:uroporphyrinogen decarboxylase
MVGTSLKRSTKPLLRVLAGETLARPPWWLMRQAGRYLPEYRVLREKAGDFISLCLTPKLAAEVTLQPIRRFGMDAAILFSDILLVPRVLGQPLAYEADGPHLAPITDTGGLRPFDETDARSALAAVGEAAERVRAALADSTALIGFAGAPWTVATYMVEGGVSRDFQRVKSWAFRDPADFGALVDLIVEATLVFLELQIVGGVEVVQLFDSWAGVLPADHVERWVIAPTKRIVGELKRRHPEIPVIGFPRGAGLMIERYVLETGVDAVALDTAVPPAYARDVLEPRLPVQGNLDPLLLRAGGPPMRTVVTELRAMLGAGPYIFNLGHGVLPDTPPSHVAELARMLAEPLTI